MATAGPSSANGAGFQENSDFIAFDFSDQESEQTAQREDKGKSRFEARRNRRAKGRGNGKDEADGGGKGKKRAYDQGPGSSRKAQGATPWFDELEWQGKTVQQMLTAEIASFVSFIRPTPDEHELRTLVVEGLRRAIRSEWPDADVYPFGSFGTLLYLPGGDIDLVVLSKDMGKQRKASVLQMLASLVKKRSLGWNVVVIAKAKVPILKFQTAHGAFNVDISINQSNGLESLKTIRELLEAAELKPGAVEAAKADRQKGKGHRPPASALRSEKEEENIQVARSLGPARCLIFVIKSLLKHRGMNEVFTGGLGSYSIICIVISFLQLHPMIQRQEIDPIENLGVLLIDFFRLYGDCFNYDLVGITLRNGGGYFDKRRRGWDVPQRPFLLSIEDPANIDNDISAGSFNILSVRAAFGGAYDLLTATLYHRQSLLLSRATNGAIRPHLSVPVPANSLNDVASDGGAASGRKTRFTEEGEIEDPLRQSLLGDIMGVTQDILAARQANLQLFASGKVQQSLETATSSVTASSTRTQNGGGQPSITQFMKPRPKKEAEQGTDRLAKKRKREANEAPTHRSKGARNEAVVEARAALEEYVALESSDSDAEDSDEEDGEDGDGDDDGASQYSMIYSRLQRSGRESAARNDVDSDEEEEEGEEVEPDDGQQPSAATDPRGRRSNAASVMTAARTEVDDDDEDDAGRAKKDDEDDGESRYSMTTSRLRRSTAPSLGTAFGNGTLSADASDAATEDGEIEDSSPNEDGGGELPAAEAGSAIASAEGRTKLSAADKQAMWLAKAAEKQASEPDDDYQYAQEDAE